MEIIDVSEDQEEALGLILEDLLANEKKVNYRLDYQPKRKSLIIHFNNKQDEERILGEVKKVKFDDNLTFSVQRYLEGIQDVKKESHATPDFKVEVLDATDEDLVVDHFRQVLGYRPEYTWNEGEKRMIICLKTEADQGKVLSVANPVVEDLGPVRVRRVGSSAGESHATSDFKVEVLDATDEDLVVDHFRQVLGYRPEYTWHEDEKRMIICLKTEADQGKVLSVANPVVEDLGPVRVRRVGSSAGGASTSAHTYARVLNVTDEYFVGEYFDRLVGRKVLYTYDSEQSSMVLTLADETEIEKVFSKELHEIKDYGTVWVKKLRQAAKGLKVSGIPPNVSVKFLNSYFKREENCGGDIKSLNWEPASGTATIFYVDDAVAQRVLKKQGHEIRGVALTLDVIEEQPTDTQPGARTKRHRLGISVSEIPEGISEKYVEFYFKKPVNGGGSIKTYVYDKQGRQAKIFYEENHVALTVAARSHKLRDVAVPVLPIEEEWEEDTCAQQEVPTAAATGAADSSADAVPKADATAEASLVTATFVMHNLTTLRSTQLLEKKIVKRWHLQAGEYRDLWFNPSLDAATVTVTTTPAKLKGLQAQPLDKESTIEECPGDPKSLLEDIHILIDRISVETSREAVWCWTKVVSGRFPHTIFYSQVVDDNCTRAVALIAFTPDLDIDHSIENARKGCHKVDCQTLSMKVISAPLQIQVSNITNRSSFSELAIKRELAQLLGDDASAISDIQVQGKTAIVTFDSRKAHRKVLSQSSLLQGRAVFSYYEDIGIITDQQLVHYDKIVRDIEEDVPSDVVRQLVLPRLVVTGFKDKVSLTMLERFFRNRNISGGDKSASLTLSEDEAEAILTFDNADAPDRVFQQFKGDGLRVQNCSLSIAIKGMREIPGSAQDQVLVKNIEQASEDSIKFFLWGLTGTSIGQLTFVRDPQDLCVCALVRFSKNIDRYLLALRMKAVPLDSTWLEIEPIRPQLTLILRNVPIDADQNGVELCFEDDRLEKCSMQEPGTWIAIFKDHMYADQAYCSGIKYNDKVELSLEYPSAYTEVANAREKGKRGQKVVQLHVSKEIISFTNKHRGLDFEKLLRDTECQCKVGEDGSMSIVLASSSAQLKMSAEQWRRTEEKYQAFFSLYDTCHVEVLPTLWDDIVASKEFNDVQGYDKGVLDLQPCKTDSAGGLCTITMVGQKDSVQRAHELIKVAIRRVNDERERQKQRTSHSENISQWLARALTAQDFCSKLQSTHKELTVQLDESRGVILLEGFPAVINAALDEIRDFGKASTEENFEVSAIASNFMQKETISASINKKLAEANLAASVTWEIPHAGSVHVLGLNAEATQEATRIIRSEISEAFVELGDGYESVVKNDKWKDCKDAICGRRAGDVVIAEEVEACRLRLVCKTSDSAPILEEVNNFTRRNLMKKSFLPVSKIMMQLLTTTFMPEVLALEKLQAHNHVRLMARLPDRGKCGYDVEGNVDGIANINRILNEFLTKKQMLTVKQHTIQAPGAARHFRDHPGILQGIGKQSSTYIEVFDPAAQEECDVEEGDAVAETSLPGGVMLSVLKADITQLDCDAIVNPCNKDLRHMGGLARIIADAGGREIEEESNAYISKNGPLPEGQACVTSAGKGKLRCKRVVHAVGPRWEGGRRNEVNKLFQAVQNSLFAVEQEGLSSVALPPISSGIFGYPLDKCTNTIVESVAAYCESKKGSLTRVMLVDINDDGVANFKRALDLYLGIGADKGNHQQPDGKPALKQARPKTSMPVPVTDLEEKNVLQSGQRMSLTSGRIDIEVLQDNLVTQKVDAIVSTIGQDLDLSKGMLSRIVLEHAGDDIKKELQKTYSVPMQMGGIAITSGGKLKCRHVFHACCPRFDPNGGSTLQSLVRACLDEAEKLKLSSIAFPALGTGNLGHSAEAVAEQMYTTALQFGQLNRMSTLTNVKFVMPTAELYSTFKRQQDKLVSPTTLQQNSQAAVQRNLQTPVQQNSQSGSPMKGRTEAFNYEEQAAKEAASPESIPVPSKKVPSAAAKGHLEIKGVKVQVVVGDITDETSIIVNCTDRNLSLNGQVSKALCRKGGPRIAEDCRRKKHIKGEGVFLADAGDLNCDHILHVDAHLELADIMTKCLQQAVDVQAKCISFPAVGTGTSGRSASDVAPALLDALTNFLNTTRCPYLKDIRFVILDDAVAQDFQNALETAFANSKSPSTSLMSRFGGYLKTTFGFRGSSSSGVGASSRAPPIVESLESVDDASDDKDDASEILLTICGSEGNIKTAVSLLEQHCRDEEHTEDLREPSETIRQLTDDEIRRMLRYGDLVGVAIGVDRDDGAISLRSLDTAALPRARALITKHLYDHSISRLNKTVSDLGQSMTKYQEDNIGSRVQWQYKENQSSEWLNYPKSLNAKLEQTNENKQPCLKYGPPHNRYTVDLTSKRDSSESQQDADVIIRRQDLSLGLPNEWSSNPEYCEEVLDKSSKEYQVVEKEFMSTLGGTSFKVLEITRVQNPKMYKQYLLHKERTTVGMSPNCSLPVERKLWHGTNIETLPLICQGGFNRSYCGKNATVYGKGVYFARDALYSSSNTYSVPNAANEKFIMQCLVLTGEYHRGTDEMLVPMKKPSKPLINYDTTVNDINNPSIFVVYHDAQAYPAYIIKFKG